MQLTIRNLMPDALADEDTSGSTLWGRNLELAQGNRYLVDGSSGRGKTTFLMLLYGIRRDYRGTIAADGRSLRDLSRDDWAELRGRRLGIVFQDLRLFPRLSALENLTLKAEVTGKPDLGRIRRLAERLGVHDLLDKPCARLSYGQQQRVAILRSLLAPFDFLLLDEPFSNLDEDNARRASELIADECDDRGAGLVLTSVGGEPHFDYTATYRV